MSKAIRNLSKWRPNDEEWDHLFDEVRTQTDRGAGIIAGSFLDSALQLALQSYLVPEPVLRATEDAGAPLSTFSARILLGEALGFYTAGVRKRLDTVRHIRNAFAHTLKPITFDEPSISEACKELKLFGFHGDTPPIPETWSEARKRYVSTCYRHAHDLVGVALKHGGRLITIEIDESQD